MKVYVVEGAVQWEGMEVLGVYSTIEKAKDSCPGLTWNDDPLFNSGVITSGFISAVMAGEYKIKGMWYDQIQIILHEVDA